jgi:hypothetical protein
MGAMPNEDAMPNSPLLDEMEMSSSDFPPRDDDEDERRRRRIAGIYATRRRIGGGMLDPAMNDDLPPAVDETKMRDAETGGDGTSTRMKANTTVGVGGGGGLQRVRGQGCGHTRRGEICGRAAAAEATSTT